MITETIKTVGLEILKADNLPELQGWREKQLKTVKDNPFIEIVDNKTYEEGKKARTNLLTARTDIQKQETAIASKIAQFRKEVSKASADLIAITQPHEDKQQEEVKKYEAAKAAEKAEKERIEQERKDAIKKDIEEIYIGYKVRIQNLTYQQLEDFNMEEVLSKTDTDKFEEFELDFLEKSSLLKAQLKEKAAYLQEKEEQRKEAERLEIARKELEAERQKEAEAQKAENDRLAKERAELQAEKDAIEKQKEDIRKKEEAEAKAKADAEEKKRLESEKKAAEKRAKDLLPDVEKLTAFIESIGFTAAQPEIKDEKLNDFLIDLKVDLDQFKSGLIGKLLTIK